MDDGNTRFASTQGEIFTREEIQKILFTETYEETFGSLGAKEAYHELLRLKKKEIELHLHGVSLSDYYRENKVPRGFRINNTPTLGRNNADFCKRWCQVLDRCSLDLMLLVIEEVGRELKLVRSDLSSFNKTHLKTLQSDRETEWLVRLEEQTGKFKAELLAFKSAKRLKVIQDYKENTVYLWQQNASVRKRRMEWRTRRSPARSAQSGASESEGETSAQETPRQQVPFLGERRHNNGDPGRPPVGGVAATAKDTRPQRQRTQKKGKE
ncbi:uncharacterized protein LOC121399718 [Xenopus laevis]|uniref:Uncharacterized protein LOC121399718 n=1 Tax=Xenopus laevis TaxID=8355 RepID=A0A8J1M832_XENLA|nr:uncharacterized protein LOC121399718 [Xenopus laevis]